MSTPQEEIIKGACILLAAACFLISFVHYSIIKCMHKDKVFHFSLCKFGYGLSAGICILGNFFFKIPMLSLLFFKLEKNGFACFYTIFLCAISCFALSFITYYFISFSDKFIENSYFAEDYGSYAFSTGFYTFYIAIYLLLDGFYFYGLYSQRYLAFSGQESPKINSPVFQYIIFGLNVISIVICVFNGIVCTWFYIKKKEKKLFLKCVLFPSIITSISFFSLFLYQIFGTKIVGKIFVTILPLTSTALSFHLRIKIFREEYREPKLIEISKEEEDDLVEYINDRICIENFNKEKRIEIPYSFSGIKFGSKYNGI